MASWDWHYETFGELLSGPEMQAAMGRHIEQAASAARSIAPVGGPGDEHPGLYRDSFETDVSVEDLGGRRAVGRLKNTAPYAAAVEWGNRRAPAQHVLARALDFMRE
jgi:hypothetical protein